MTLKTSETQAKFEEFKHSYEELYYLGSAQWLLHWDQNTYMPDQGVHLRAKVESYLASTYHKLSTDPKITDLVEALSETNHWENLDPIQKAAVSESSWQIRKSSCLSNELVRELSEAQSRGYSSWNKAKQNSDFTLFQGPLERLVELELEKAKAYQSLKPSFSTPYNALIDSFEPGFEVSHYDPLFEELKVFLTEIQSEFQNKDSSAFTISAPVAEQKALNRSIAQAIGFDFSRGRIDESPHPFSIGTRFDTRITTRYKESNLLESLLATIHEVGHSLYEQNLPLEDEVLPSGESRSMGVHESQSLFWENCIARSYPFMKFLKQHTANLDCFKSFDAKTLFSRLNQVVPSLIRVDADETTYHLHIVVRYEIEKALIGGDISVKELPDVWNEKYRKYLGVTPTNDAEGVLQDVHWSTGSFGYFPSYTIGAVLAAQLYEAMLKDHPDTEEKIEKGEFKPILGWLTKMVHEKASRHSTHEIIEGATGAALSADAFKNYIRNRLQAAKA